MAERPLTPTMVACLRLVAGSPGVYIPALAEACAPRATCPSTGRPYTWSRQGAARMGGKLAKALESRGLVRRDHHVDCGVGRLHLTEAGALALLELQGLAP